MRHRHTTTPMLLAGLLSLGLGAPALAADENANREAAGTPGPITDQQLKQFAAALSDVRDIRTEYTSKLRQADSREERQNLKKRGQREMVQVIRDSGLDLKQYNRIGGRVGGDKELRQRMKEMLGQQSG